MALGARRGGGSRYRGRGVVGGDLIPTLPQLCRVAAAEVACLGKLPAPSVLGPQGQATHQVQLTPHQSGSFCKGLLGTGSNKQSQAAKMQGLIMQCMEFPGPFVLSHQLPRALQKKVLEKDRLVPGFTGGLLPGLTGPS